MAGDFRNGTTFEMDGGVFRVVEFQHVKPGKGAAFVRTKLKNVITGAVLEKTFNPSDKYPGAEIEKKTMAKISIIVPVYNVSKYLKRSLDSLINQTLKDLEIIIVNDGSYGNDREHKSHRKALSQ